MKITQIYDKRKFPNMNIFRYYNHPENTRCPIDTSAHIAENPMRQTFLKTTFFRTHTHRDKDQQDVKKTLNSTRNRPANTFENGGRTRVEPTRMRARSFARVFISIFGPWVNLWAIRAISTTMKTFWRHSMFTRAIISGIYARCIDSGGKFALILIGLLVIFRFSELEVLGLEMCVLSFERCWICRVFCGWKNVGKLLK